MVPDLDPDRDHPDPDAECHTLTWQKTSTTQTLQINKRETLCARVMARPPPLPLNAAPSHRAPMTFFGIMGSLGLWADY